jgi:hypothetical protein
VGAALRALRLGDRLRLLIAAEQSLEKGGTAVA